MTFGVRLALLTRRAIQLCSVVTFLLISGFGSNGYALDAREYAVETSVEVLNAPFRLRLTWRPSGLARSYTIRRRDYLSADWGTPRATLPAGSSEFVDTQVTEGRAYEYEIQMESTVSAPGGWVNAFGYALAGGKVSWPDQKGKVLVLVDPVLVPALNPEIDIFQRDLIGAGWIPIRRDFERASTVADVKNLIRAEYNADRANVRAVILLGHLPVPYSGNIAPDLHPSHKGAWPADVFYGEMDGTWTDSEVDIISGDSRSNDNRPGDGKFDQSQIPSHVELEVGRVDFANLPTFTSSSAVDLLRRYLQKNHDFRHRVFTSSRRGLIRDNFGDLDGDAPAVDAWRHYPQFFGPSQVREVGPGSFFSTLNNESFLWAYGCGGGGNNKADGVGTTADFATQSTRAVFLILHGSYFGDWNVTDNFLRAGIASSGHTLASIWSGLPHWYMHPMGLGANVGSCTRLTQNNVNQYRSHQNLSAQQVHISLLGDPTLEMFPVIPPRNFAGSAAANINLSWSPSSDENIIGYHLYHSPSSSGPFNRITSSPVVTTSFSHAAGIGTHHYMVRAVKLERTGSGTFYNLSQGIFTSVTKTSGGIIPQVTIAVEDGSVSEAGPNTGTVRISRNMADENQLTVQIMTGGTAQDGIDYSSIAPSVVIPAWANDARISIVPIADLILEGSETVSVQIKPSVSYTIGDPQSVTIDVLDLNRPPTISQIPDQTIEAGTISSALSFTVNDPESAPTLEVRAQSSHPELIPISAIVFNGTGSNRTVQLLATNTDTGLVTITLFVTDGVNEVSTEFNVTVTAPNRPPLAHPQNISTVENQALPIVLSGQDPEGQVLSFLVKVGPTNGTLSGAAPNLTYHPSSNFFGTDSFSFAVSDGRHESAAAPVFITVTELNRPPIALGGAAQTLEDHPVTFELAASDPNQDLLTFEIVVQPTNGQLSGTNNFYQYIPGSNAFGADSFTFRVRDSEFVSAPAIFELNIIPTNDPPSALSSQFWIEEEETIFISLTGIDPEEDPLAFTVISPPTNGVLSGTAPDLTYTPRADFSGHDTFRYVVSDGIATSSVATVSIEISPVNDLPTASSLDLFVDEDNVRSFILSGADRDNDPLTFEILAFPTNGVITGSPPNLTYNPKLNFHGTDLLRYVAKDGKATSAIATISFLVEPVNDEPVANNQAFITNEDEAREIQLSAVDPDGDQLTFALVDLPQHGSLEGTPPNLVYKPAPDFNGADNLTFAARDGAGGEQTGRISITILSQNDPPTIGDLEERIIPKNHPAGPMHLEVNDIDHSISQLTFTAGSSNPTLIPTNKIQFGSLETSPVVTLFPNNGEVGTALITLSVSDGEAAASTTFTLTVTNTPPVAVHDFLSIVSGTVTLPVASLLTNDWDGNRDPLKINSVSESLRGHRVILTNDTVVYFGDGAGGEDWFSYTAEDTSQDSAVAGVWLSLTANPQIRSVRVLEGDVLLHFTGEPHRAFKVWCSLDAVYWENIGSGTSGGTGTAVFKHTNGAGPHHRFYRVEWP